jgi:hypothetical protein
MIKRRAFLGGAFCAAAAANRKAQSATASPQNVATSPSEPLVWPVVTKLPPDIRSFAGHTDTGARYRRSARNAGELGALYRRQSPDGAAQRRYRRCFPVVDQVAAAIRRSRCRQYRGSDRPMIE